MLKSEDGIYTFLYNGKNLVQDLSKTQAEEFLKELLSKIKNQSDDAVKKYLDEVLESINLRKGALTKYINKFDTNLFNHISGDVAIETIKIVFREVSYIGTLGQGGHWINKFLEVIKITHPTGISNIIDLLDNIPFKAKVRIKSLKGKIFPKNAESSMFPKNWDELRIKEEIAYVYENTFIKKLNKRPRQVNDKFDKYEGLTTNGFKVRIEVDSIGNIVNAYPIL